jgi:hypothetical protein
LEKRWGHALFKIEGDGGVVRVELVFFSTVSIRVEVKLNSFLPVMKPVICRHFENMFQVAIVDFICVRIDYQEFTISINFFLNRLASQRL